MENINELYVNDSKIIQFLHREYTPYEKQCLDLGSISPKIAKILQEKCNIDPSAYQHQIDNYALKHIKNKHTDLSDIDFARIPEILQNPDSVFLHGKSKRKLFSIKYMKAFNGTTYYVEEVRAAKERLNLVTMYKTKTK